VSRPLAWAALIGSICLTALLFGAGHGARGDPATVRAERPVDETPGPDALTLEPWMFTAEPALSEGGAELGTLAEEVPHDGRASVGVRAASSSESADPRERYIDYLERSVHRLATRAERNERRLKRARFVFRRSLGTSPLGNHWLEDAFQCIHRYEAGWGAATGNGYYGGLQFDMNFQRAYGPEFLRAIGTANHWPRSVQITVAIRGYLARGFQPWPNTRRACGL
jgi:Transglycosylase-like domain